MHAIRIEQYHGKSANDIQGGFRREVDIMFHPPGGASQLPMIETGWKDKKPLEAGWACQALQRTYGVADNRRR